MEISAEISHKICDYMKISENSDCFSLNNNVRSVLVYGTRSEERVLVTYIIPTYKRPEYLADAINSILEQDDNAFSYEIIVVDNSADMSIGNKALETIKKIKTDKVALYVNEDNLGMIGNWNRGIILANSKYISFLHDDDVLLQNYGKLMRCAIETADRRGSKWGCIVAKKRDFHDNDEALTISKISEKEYSGIRRFYKINSLITNMIGPTSCPTCGMLFLRKAVIEAGGFNDMYYPSSDYVLGQQLLNNGYAVYMTVNTLGLYRIAENESRKVETYIRFFLADYCFREYMYSESATTRIFAKIFKGIQYKESLNWLYGAARRFGIKVDKKDMDFIGESKDSQFLYFIYRVIRKVVRQITSRVYC